MCGGAVTRPCAGGGIPEQSSTPAGVGEQCGVLRLCDVTDVIESPKDCIDEMDVGDDDMLCAEVAKHRSFPFAFIQNIHQCSCAIHIMKSAAPRSSTQPMAIAIYKDIQFGVVYYTRGVCD